MFPLRSSRLPKVSRRTPTIKGRGTGGLRYIPAGWKSQTVKPQSTRLHHLHSHNTCSADSNMIEGSKLSNLLNLSKGKSLLTSILIISMLTFKLCWYSRVLHYNIVTRNLLSFHSEDFGSDYKVWIPYINPIP